MAKHKYPTKAKAKKMLHEGKVHGKPITKKQRGYFGEGLKDAALVLTRDKLKLSFFAENGLTKTEVEFPDEEEAYAKKVEEDFRKKGSKHFIEILKGEFKNTPLSVKVSVAGKSKNLAVMTDKIVNIFRFAFSNPQGFAQVMQIPGMAKSFNQILEFSGMSPADFSGIEKLAMQQQTQQKASLPVEETVNV